MKRPHVFIKELNLYIDYLQQDIQEHVQLFTARKKKQLEDFRSQLFNGLNYYKNLFEEVRNRVSFKFDDIAEQLNLSGKVLESPVI